MRKILRRTLTKVLFALLAAAVLPSCDKESPGLFGGGALTGYPTPTALPFASPTDGVAPLAVFFNAGLADMAGTDILQPADNDYATFHYSWDFGDPGSGTWSTDGRSKNVDLGFTAAHVYENPGIYTATLTLTDNLGIQHLYQAVITVTALVGNTFYVSTSGSDLNTGSDPASPWQTVAKAIANAGTNTRIRFKRGDTFTTDGGHFITSPGPGILDSYGAGAKPVIQMTGQGGGFAVYNNDWKIMDLDLIGSGPGDQAFGIYFKVSSSVQRTVILRVSARNFRVGLGWSIIDGVPSHDTNAIVDCSTTNNDVNELFVGSVRLMLQGTVSQNPVNSHVARVWQAHRGVINHNIFRDPSSTRHSLKLHGPGYGSGAPPTMFVTVSDNQLRGAVWTAVIGPQDDFSDQRVSQIILERNLVTSVSNGQTGFILQGWDIVVRNNIFDGSATSSYWTACDALHEGVVPPPGRIKIENNTVFRSGAGAEGHGFSFSTDSFGMTVRNNLVSFPSMTTKSLIGSSGSGLVLENNLFTDTPGFVNAAGGDFHLTGGSAALNAGVATVDVREDMNRTARPQGAGIDIGAFEQ